MRIMIKLLLVTSLLSLSAVSLSAIRLKEVARIDGVRDFDVTGYGIVVGLAGTGDSPRSKATLQSVKNALIDFGVNVDMADISSRNVAAVFVTAKLPAFAQSGDKVDISVSSVGDARSLVGGTLLLTPLKAVDKNVYALAQGQISVGGFKFDFNGNMVQKNHPTVGLVPSGATVERAVNNRVVDEGVIRVLLNNPDFTTANRVSKALKNALEGVDVKALNAGKVEIRMQEKTDVIDLLAQIEAVRLTPDRVATVVVNERTGTLVSGGDVRIDNVTIAHGDLKVVIETDYEASQPALVRQTGSDVKSLVLSQSELSVNENIVKSVQLSQGATIAELVTALRGIKTSTRDVITILQAIHKADALHAQLIIQ